MRWHHAVLIRTGLAAALLILLLSRAQAQDTRQVTEPVIPTARCAVLPANLTAVDSDKTLAEADEGKLDTTRIQRAIDRLEPKAGGDSLLNESMVPFQDIIHIRRWSSGTAFPTPPTASILQWLWRRRDGRPR